MKPGYNTLKYHALSTVTLNLPYVGWVESHKKSRWVFLYAAEVNCCEIPSEILIWLWLCINSVFTSVQCPTMVVYSSLLMHPCPQVVNSNGSLPLVTWYPSSNCHGIFTIRLLWKQGPIPIDAKQQQPKLKRACGCPRSALFWYNSTVLTCLSAKTVLAPGGRPQASR